METLSFPLLVAMQPTCTQQYRSGERIHATIRPRLLGNHATRQYRVVSVSMEVFNFRLHSNDGIGPNTSQYIYTYMLKSKAIRHRGLYDCEMFRIPHYLDDSLTVGGKIVNLTYRRHSAISVPGIYFCQSLSKPQALVVNTNIL
jgi:hypothetical protein